MSLFSYWIAIIVAGWCLLAFLVAIALGCWLRRWEREEQQRREILKRFEEE